MSELDPSLERVREKNRRLVEIINVTFAIFEPLHRLHTQEQNLNIDSHCNVHLVSSAL